MSDLSIFSFDQSAVRVVTVDGEPWFVAADVCAALTIGNNRDALTRLDDDEKGVGSIYTPGGSQEMAIINEFGLYSLILGSRKPEARRFKRWVTHEVLPSIRKTGSYGQHQQQQPPALPHRPGAPALPARPMPRYQRHWVNSTSQAMGMAFAQEARSYLLDAIATIERARGGLPLQDADLAQILAFTSLMEVARFHVRRMLAAESALTGVRIPR